MEIQQTLDSLEIVAQEMIETAQNIMDAIAVERAAIRCCTGKEV